MYPYLHILIRVEDDGSLHALGAFSSKESQMAYQEAIGLSDKQVRLDFYNGPFDENIKVIYAGHRRWNMTRFQLGGYFRTEGEAWTWVTQEGYVSVLRIDTTYEEEKLLEKRALEEYAKLQKSWRLSSYEDIIAREGIDKARANIMLRFYEDALESFKPKTRRDSRALYAFLITIIIFPFAIYYMLQQGPKYGENVASVDWLPSYASDISFYRSDQVNIYEFSAKLNDFKLWAESQDMRIVKIINPVSISRYTAYIPREKQLEETDGKLTDEEFGAWQRMISAKVKHGFFALKNNKLSAVYDFATEKVYFEDLKVVKP